MTIDFQSFTPWASLAGGVLIGAAAAIYVLGNGRVAGIAGIVASPLQSMLGRTSNASRIDWVPVLFLIGLFISPWLWRLVAALPSSVSVASTWALVLAGVLVGVGVRMGNGCTSGHGVCGLARFSLRSFVNVLAFMGAGFTTVFVIRHFS
jgi:uncharacterized protein